MVGFTGDGGRCRVLYVGGNRPGFYAPTLIPRASMDRCCQPAACRSSDLRRSEHWQ